jgi:periplasmic protein TonB
MFSTLESSWDKSARRGWSALASFTFQAMALSLLLAIPMFWVQGPPRLQWLQSITNPPMPAPAQAAEEPVRERVHAGSVSNLLNDHLLQPQRIPIHAVPIDDWKSGPPLPDLPGVRFERGVNIGAPNGFEQNVSVTLKPPSPTHPLKISHWAEGNLIYRVQPVYPPLARQARIQGAVQLRAVISKTGTIEHLTLESGHPMLAGAALDAVRQWRYRPYLLNDEPVEIETQVIVNFVLSGG